MQISLKIPTIVGIFGIFNDLCYTIFMDYIKIDKSIKTAIYIQVADSIEAAILSKKLRHAYQLPTEKDIADLYCVSIGIVKRAFVEMEDRDIVYRVKGKGSFVKHRAKHLYKLHELQLDTLTHLSFYQALLEKTKRTEKLGPVYHKMTANFLLHTLRIFTEDEFSICIEESFIDPRAFKINEALLQTQNSISSLLIDKQVVALKRLENVMFATEASSKEAQIFQIEKGAAISQIDSSIKNEQGEIVAYITRKFPSEFSLFQSEVRNV
jgi:DNA-binding GntR family transcriptional regulator